MADALPERFRVEILEGSIVASPTPSPKHAEVIRRISEQMSPQLPGDLACYQVLSVGISAESSEYASPDLTVFPIAKARESDDWLSAPDSVELVVEVASPGNARTDTETKPRVYASMGIPVYLLIDPRDGSLVCYSDPREGAYQATHRMKFGDTVVLPEPLKDVRIETADLPRDS
ncbi:Uma2 family endonuclease [Streptomonospora algeriensis]|uniref:Uma2 family endonuclease n=1 Tax=Streptomonospora algeriensis TaxID=995084 RepID=A0ABW3BE85_9ACTN